MKQLCVLCLNWFQEAWGNPYYRGLLTAFAIMVGLMILSWIIRFLLFLRSRRRCRFITVSTDNGDIIIALDAITTAVRNILEKFTQLTVRRIHFRKNRNGYSMLVRCTYANNGSEPGVPELNDKIKPLISEKIHNFFGITDSINVTLRIDRYHENDDEYQQAPDSAATTAPQI